MRDRNGFVVEVECIFFPASSSMHALLDIYVPFFFLRAVPVRVIIRYGCCLHHACFGACSARHHVALDRLFESFL
jgi:hypothetical protein